MRSLVLLASAAAALVLGGSPLTQHDAKVRTFKALLHLTELPPDAGDATHAAITVGHCSRRSYGFRCNGTLYPVAFSGIGGSACDYTVLVFRHSVRVFEGNCS